MIFSKFAQFYDELFDPAMYQKWLDFVLTNSKPEDRLIDLACGTGRLIVSLAKLGYHTTGLDFSDDMLSIAEQHAIDNNVSPFLIQGNMLDLSNLDQYSIITCFDDSLCYLKNQKELLRAFLEVYQHLSDHGVYLFDVISPYQTDVVYPGYMYNYHDKNRAFMWQSYEGDKPHSVEHDLTFFYYNYEKDAYDEYSELHHERTYDLNIYIQLLKKAGFNQISATADFGKSKINKTTTRYFFKCKKD
ncbi:methyltransferase [Philodulcilactobacillus myokoensis]|uniref:Methyltransferase n=1 Tax=Philodulcilactobacillus myokoensis TaxID=2929573 RepID=A0A9W6ESS1_9LACO|nr:class I SAM-dependent methyltransferase [Philodulcilactobacillus myokoensis]GLB46762.1 methyltransferase [Philodulcilactobacillus myokoensis]